MDEEIDIEELAQIEGGNDWYGPCGCIDLPLPCPGSDPGPM